MNIKIELTESEARLLRIICDCHEMDDEEQNERNKAYQETKKSMFKKVKDSIDKELK